MNKSIIFLCASLLVGAAVTYAVRPALYNDQGEKKNLQKVICYKTDKGDIIGCRAPGGNRPSKGKGPVMGQGRHPWGQGRGGRKAHYLWVRKHTGKGKGQGRGKGNVSKGTVSGGNASEGVIKTETDQVPAELDVKQADVKEEEVSLDQLPAELKTAVEQEEKEQDMAEGTETKK